MAWSGRGLHNEGADKEIDEVMMNLLSFFFGFNGFEISFPRIWKLI